MGYSTTTTIIYGRKIADKDLKNFESDNIQNPLYYVMAGDALSMNFREQDMIGGAMKGKRLKNYRNTVIINNL